MQIVHIHLYQLVETYIDAVTKHKSQRMKIGEKHLKLHLNLNRYKRTATQCKMRQTETLNNLRFHLTKA